ncbi:MAG: DUF5941 domain-containing protein [Candidatus Nanopelagicales bacterium]
MESQIGALIVPGAAAEESTARLAALGVNVQMAPAAGCPAVLDWLADHLSARTLLVDGALENASASLGQLVDDPAVNSGALVSTGAIGPADTPVRVRHHRIVSAGSMGLAPPAAGPAARGFAATAGGTWGDGAWEVPICWGLPPASADQGTGEQPHLDPSMFDAPASGAAAPGLPPAPPSLLTGTVAIEPLGAPQPAPTPGEPVDASPPERIPSAGAADSGAGSAPERTTSPPYQLIHQVTQPSGVFLGALVIGAGHVSAARAALRAVAQAARQHNWVADPIDLALVALVRAQISMAAVGAVGPWFRRGAAGRRAQTVAGLAGLDEARILLERANRPDDGFYSTFVLRKASKPVTALALRLGLTPNQISLGSLVIGLSAAACFATGQRWGMVPGAILLQASLIVDCVDGEVARFTRSFSQFGAWLDASTDRVKEYAAYAGLAWGAARHGSDLWLLAAIVMVLQTVRHIGDYNFSRVQRVREAWVPARELALLDDGGEHGTGSTLAVSAALSERRNVRWAKKVLHMPIGERWLAISLGAVLVGPRGTFCLLLALGLTALSYTLIGRVLRARRWQHPIEQSGEALLLPQLDFGPLGAPVWSGLTRGKHPLAGAFGWAIPVTLRVIEFAVVLLCALRLGGLDGWWGAESRPASAGNAAVFAWLFVVAFHHYDTLYRALGGSAPPRWLEWLGLGWEGRTLVVGIAAALGGTAFSRTMQVGSLLFATLFVVIGSAQWVVAMHARQADG